MSPEYRRTRYPLATRNIEVENIVLLVTVHTERAQKIAPIFTAKRIVYLCDIAA